MSLTFKILAESAGGGRRAQLDLPHQVVQAPVFMPVGTAGSVKAVAQDVVESLGAQIILGNTYHLYLRPGHEAIRRMGGLHRFISWPRAMLTDSGGFQVFSLSQLRKVTDDGVRFRSHLDGSSHFFTPEHSMDVQIALGADISMAFDECTEYPAEREQARKSMEMTARWAERAKRHFEEHQQEVPWGEVSSFKLRVSSLGARNSKLETGNSSQALFGIVQGGMYADLRRESAERTVAIGFPGYAIGGLSVGEPRALTREMVEATLPHLPQDQPRYLMGVGTPDEIVEYAALGIDMMDCVLPTRAARHGLLYTSEGKLAIKNARFAQDEKPLDPRCGCRVCARYSRAYLRHLYSSNETLAAVLNTIHNLAFYLDTMRQVRQSIKLGGLEALLSEARSHSLNSSAQGEDPA